MKRQWIRYITMADNCIAGEVEANNSELSEGRSGFGQPGNGAWRSLVSSLGGIEWAAAVDMGIADVAPKL